MSDLISRDVVLDTIHRFFTEEVDRIPTKKTEDGEVLVIRKCQPLFEMNKAICKRIKALPSTSPTQNYVGNALDALDCISRQGVLDAMSDTWKHICSVARRRKPTKGEEAVYSDMVGTVNNLPSVNPQEPKYCDRNICISNEYNGISCDECEVTKSQEKSGDLISRDEVIDILLNEMECVQRASDEECNRDCAKCDLLRDTDKILQAYRIAIRALEHPEENVVAIVRCDDAISRQKVLDVINLNWYYRKNYIEAIENLPSVNPQPKTGHWIRVDDSKLKCSECEVVHFIAQYPSAGQINFCPNCGARMVESQERSDKE